MHNDDECDGHCNHNAPQDSITITNNGKNITLRFNNLLIEGDTVQDIVLEVNESAIIILDLFTPGKEKELLDFKEQDFSDKVRDALK